MTHARSLHGLCAEHYGGDEGSRLRAQDSLLILEKRGGGEGGRRTEGEREVGGGREIAMWDQSGQRLRNVTLP